VSAVVQWIKRVLGVLDRWQRHNRVVGATWGVLRKFSDDEANLLVVALGWYGFTAIYPLLLVVVAVFGFIGEASLGSGIVRTLHQFPVIGTEFTPGPGGSKLHGSTIGLIIGVVGLVYGAQGVTQTAEQAMARVWNQAPTDLPGFLPRLGRSLGGLATIGAAFVANAFVASIAAGHGQPLALRIAPIAGLVVVNVGFYLLAFRVLTSGVALRKLVPGSLAGAVAFTTLITVGAGLVQHQLRNSSATYGALGAVIGVVAFLLLLAKLSLFAAELNPVLARHLWPRALPTGEPTAADNQVLRDLALAGRRRADERISVGLGPEASAETATKSGPDGGRTSGRRSGKPTATPH
jgi:uncharacterized BrkB/YihY/UPF0761 family membrane protein